MQAEHLSFAKQAFAQQLSTLQDEIVQALEAMEPTARFQQETWQRPGGGGGNTRILQQGRVFEKAGVNTSQVHGTLPPAMQQQLGVTYNWFYANGLSLVLHPVNPQVPTVHANWRYFEVYEETDGPVKDAWMGGGIDLTPYTYRPTDFKHFHGTLKNACDQVDSTYYPLFKQACDVYFTILHRGETRGIGGIFYDYLRSSPAQPWHKLHTLAQATQQAFLPAYLPLVNHNSTLAYTPADLAYQAMRRGRYVEFNLVYDRGTLFGLKTGGRIESILMSLPATAAWPYDWEPEAGSAQAELQSIFKQPREWA